jgi:hypothetical protein
MKKIFYNVIWILSAQFLLFACQEDAPQLGEAPTAEQASFTFEPTIENDNIIAFSSTSDAFLKKWDFGNGTKAEGNEVKGTFPAKGTYEVTLTVFTSGGSISSKQNVVIAETDPLLLDIPQFNNLTGGPSAANGKTWVIDKTVGGHFGVGPAESNSPDWYKAGPNEKDGAGFYDDEITFNLNGFKFSNQTNGDIFVNGAHKDEIGSNPQPAAGDYKVDYTAPDNLTWSLSEDDNGVWTLTLNGGEMGYYTGVTTFTVLTIEENELYVKYLDSANPALAWYMRFIPKGFTHPVDEPDYKITDLFENFNGSSNVSFFDDSNAQLIEAYDNPATVGINTSSKVGKYIKGDGNSGEYGNIQIRLDYKMDIRQRNKFRLKVFIPSYNDYTTTGGEGWQSYNTLQKQVSVKLQNNDLGGSAYTTQVEVKQTNLETDKWIELEFDFSGVADRTDFDQIVIQMGGEAIFTGGTFFFDDFELLP